MATSNRNVTVTKDEYALFGQAMPYIAMLIGAGLLFFTGVFIRISVWAQERWGDTAVYDSTQIATWCVLLSSVILCAVTWKLFGQRKGPFIRQHATITVALGHIWLIFALWEDLGDWMFGIPTVSAYFFGATCIGLSWALRRWSFRAAEMTEESSGFNPFEEMGLGEHTRVDKMNSHPVANGAKYRLKLALGKTIEQAKDKRTAFAQLAGKPRSLVHVEETPGGIEGQVDITILKEDPFNGHTLWGGAHLPGHSIVSPIVFATYDNGERPELFLAGKDGESSQHFLTVGMSGAGKSKAWQVIYGSVLNRHSVSVIFGDPRKGLQTGGALASGLEWFATTKDECQEQIDAVMRAISARTNHLTKRGLSHWQEGCGLNFLIFHLEEASDFADADELVMLVEAARSAGISLVLSTQRASHDRMNTSVRYNLGGNMCFGVKSKADTRMGLSEYTITSGAEPHRWQDRKKGHFYLEAANIDPRMFAHELESDWVNEKHLERVVDEGAQYRTALDNVTADAFGKAYKAYRDQVEAGTTDWQELRRNRYSVGEEQPTNGIPVTDPAYVEPAEDDLKDNPNAAGTSKKRTNADTDPEDTRRAELALWSVIMNFAENGQEMFSPKDVVSKVPGRTDSWVKKKLIAWVAEGRLQQPMRGLYRLPE
jgi:hypothetical protein